MKNSDKIKRVVLAVGASSMLSAALVGSAFAAQDNGTTSATVNAMISVAAPASIAFGAGVPGDTLEVANTTVTVISNNGAGYTLAVQASALTKGGNTIPATALKFGEGVTATAALTAAATDLLLVTTAAETDSDGTDHTIVSQLTLPFVEAGNYAGTFIFTASNIGG